LVTGYQYAPLVAFWAILDPHYEGKVKLAWVLPTNLPPQWQVYIFRKKGSFSTITDITYYFAKMWSKEESANIFVFNDIHNYDTWILDSTVENGKKYFYSAFILDKSFGDTFSPTIDVSITIYSTIKSACTIKIPIPFRIADRITKDILVFGDQTGENIFGKDLTEELDDDGLGDFKVLEPRETIKQSMQILATTRKGEISYQEDFGLDIQVGEDWERESIESFLQMKIIESYKLDPRVKDVEITGMSKQGNGLSADVKITPIIGEAVFVKENP